MICHAMSIVYKANFSDCIENKNYSSSISNSLINNLIINGKPPFFSEQRNHYHSLRGGPNFEIARGN